MHILNQEQPHMDNKNCMSARPTGTDGIHLLDTREAHVVFILKWYLYGIYLCMVVP